MKGGLFDLDQRTAGVGKRVMLLVERLRHCHQRVFALGIVLIVGIHLDPLHRAGTEFHRFMSQSLGGFPHIGIFQRAATDRALDDRRQAGLADFLQNVARRLLARRRVFRLRPHLNRTEPVEAVEDVAEPGAPADIHVEAHVAIDQNVEPGALLIAEEALHGVCVLLAVDPLSHGEGEGAAVEIADEPGRAR